MYRIPFSVHTVKLKSVAEPRGGGGWGGLGMGGNSLSVGGGLCFLSRW